MPHREIVIVEDNDDIREIIGFVLSDDSYTLKMYDSAAAFRDHMAANRPDVIVLDIMLPDGNGADMCRQIKSDPATEHIPVVLMSANSCEYSKDVHADAFIAKPFDIEQFRTQVENYLTKG